MTSLFTAAWPKLTLCLPVSSERRTLAMVLMIFARDFDVEPAAQTAFSPLRVLTFLVRDAYSTP